MSYSTVQHEPARLPSATRNAPAVAADDFDVELFFDGACPLCSREVATVRRLDRHGRVRFRDIAAPSFDEREIGVPHERLMARIHARLPDGTLIEGVEVFRRLYAAVGFGLLVKLSRAPVLRQALDGAYNVFAKNRLKLTGRCDDARCDLKAMKKSA